MSDSPNAARHAAVRRLILAHQDEYDALHREEREARGLSPTKGGDSHMLNLRIVELERRLVELGERP